MLTLFTTAKPFKGHIAVIQRNALQSWKLLHPDAEVILFGDDEGSAAACSEFGFRHEPHVERTARGSNRVDYMFAKAQEIARHDLLCYVNCDIILPSAFCPALQSVRAVHPEFLFVGRRWDTDITQPLDFSRPDWEQQTLLLARRAKRRRDPWWIDYFAFSRRLYGSDVPPFAVGRTAWDNWLIWYALDQRKPVIDASPVVVAVHQNHDYSHHQQGEEGVWKGEEAKRNQQLSGGGAHLRCIGDATRLLTPSGLQPNAYRYWSAFKRALGARQRTFQHTVWQPAWFAALDITRPLRTALGLRSAPIRRPDEES